MFRKFNSPAGSTPNIQPERDTLTKQLAALHQALAERDDTIQLLRACLAGERVVNDKKVFELEECTEQLVVAQQLAPGYAEATEELHQYKIQLASVMQENSELRTTVGITQTDLADANALHEDALKKLEYTRAKLRWTREALLLVEEQLEEARTSKARKTVKAETPITGNPPTTAKRAAETRAGQPAQPFIRGKSSHDGDALVDHRARKALAFQNITNDDESMLDAEGDGDAYGGDAKRTVGMKKKSKSKKGAVEAPAAVECNPEAEENKGDGDAGSGANKRKEDHEEAGALKKQKIEC